MVTLDFNLYGKYSGRLELGTKFTFIQGESGTGKTVVFDLIDIPKTEVKVSDGYGFQFFKGFKDFPGNIIVKLLRDLSDGEKCVFLIDEDDFCDASFEIQRVLKDLPYLFVIAYRGPWEGMPCSIDSIKKLCCKELEQGGYFYYLENLYPDHTSFSKGLSRVIREGTGAAIYRC